MGYIVIVVYVPRRGKDRLLLEQIRNHVPLLRREGLATERPVLVLRAASGAVLEIFEWVSERAYEMAHTNLTVLKAWAEFHKVCEYEVLAELPEAHRPFSPFEPVDLTTLET